MFVFFSALDRCHVSVFTYATSVYVTLSLNKPQMDMSEHGEVPTPSYSLHWAPSEMLSRQLSQSKFIMHVSGAFPVNSGHKQNRSATVCQQCVAILHFQQL